MIKTEKQIPLATQDIERLKGRKTGGMGCFLIVVIAALVISVFLFFLVGDIFGGNIVLNNGKIRLPIGIVVLPFSLAFIALAYFIKRLYTGTASKDVRGGMKRVLTAQVQRLFTEDLDPSRRSNFAIKTAYMVDIEGTHYDVKEEEFKKYSQGMWVEVHTAPRSNEFLGIYNVGDGRLLTEELL